MGQQNVYVRVQQQQGERVGPAASKPNDHEEYGKSMAFGHLSSVGNYAGGRSHARMGAHAVDGKFDVSNLISFRNICSHAFSRSLFSLKTMETTAIDVVLKREKKVLYVLNKPVVSCR